MERYIHLPVFRGGAHPSAKLSDGQREEIRSRHAHRPEEAPRVIAADYGVSDSTIRRVLSDTARR